jgi:hypothetical protein
MHGSELSPLAAPPISIPCGGCRNEMRLASVDPTNEETVYTYQCANGHQRQFSAIDPTSITGLPTVRPIAGPSPPGPLEIFSGARNNLMQSVGAPTGRTDFDQSRLARGRNLVEAAPGHSCAVDSKKRRRLFSGE